jgi:hypothetical protein
MYKFMKNQPTPFLLFKFQRVLTRPQLFISIYQFPFSDVAGADYMRLYLYILLLKT